jgi:hypothetical protein
MDVSDARQVWLEPVVECPALDGWTPPWPVAACPPDFWVVLSGRAAPGEVGLVMALLVRYRDADEIPAGAAAEALLRRALAHERLVLPGGVRARDSEGNAVVPGCCCGLEEWREWLAVTDGETSPWMGHDPWGWVEHQPDGGLRVCAAPESYEAGVEHVPAEWTVAIPPGQLSVLLTGVEEAMRGFSARVREWAAEVAPAVADELARRWDEAFEVRGPVP